MRDDHSSATRLTARLTRPTRTAERECSCTLRYSRPYSVLLPVGFALPPLLPGARCALAAPFRPCLRDALRHLARAVCFLWHFPWGRPRRRLSGTVFPWSPDFPLPLARQRPSGRLAGAEMRPTTPRRQAAGGSDARSIDCHPRPEGSPGFHDRNPISVIAVGARHRTATSIAFQQIRAGTGTGAPTSRNTASSRARVPASASPVIASGRQWRWNARSAAANAGSSAPSDATQ
jgi:hypothetical protein